MVSLFNMVVVVLSAKLVICYTGFSVVGCMLRVVMILLKVVRCCCSCVSIVFSGAVVSVSFKIVIWFL